VQRCPVTGGGVRAHWGTAGRGTVPAAPEVTGLGQRGDDSCGGVASRFVLGEVSSG